MEIEKKQVSDKPSQAIAVVLARGPHVFNHPTICSLALLNKKCEKAIKDTVGVRKKYLRQITLGKTLYPHTIFSWHPYGSAYATMKIMKSKIKKLVPEGHNIIREVGETKPKCFVRIFVLGNTPSSYTYVDFKKLIPGFSKFNAAGEFFFYCLGDNEDICLWGERQHVIEYGLKQKRAITSHRCGLKLNKKKVIALAHLVSFPGLLKACLDAQIYYSIDNFAKLYNLDNAIIPHNYPQCIPLVPGKYSYASFYTLPQDVREAIRERYNRQTIIGEK